MRVALLALMAVFSCGADETISAFADAETTWALDELDGLAWTAGGTLTFPEEGRVAGRAPCNVFTGAQAAPYPWIEFGPIAATRMACPDLEAEQRFFTALEEMTVAEVSGDTLILSNDAGRQMVFRATP